MAAASPQITLDYARLGEHDDIEGPAPSKAIANRGRFHKVALFVSAFTATLIVAVSLSAYAKPNRHQYQIGMTPKRGFNLGFQEQSALPTQLTAGYDDTCWTYTGGTCNVNACDAYRNATCTRVGVVHYCLCPTGCVDSAFSCTSERNERVASGIEFWQAGYKLYAPKSFQQLKVGRDYTMQMAWRAVPNFNFDVYQVPGDRVRYMINPTNYLDYTLSLTTTSQVAGSLWGVFDTKPDSIFSGASADPLFMFWIICRAQNGNVRLGIDTTPGAQGAYIWAYVHSASYFVYGWVEAIWGAPDGRGEWSTDATFASKLDPCPS